MSQNDNPFRLRDPGEASRATEPRLHVYGPGAVCDTESRGHAIPRDLSPAELVVDATQGFVPLWAEHTTLRWRFQKRSLGFFAEPSAATAALTELLGEAILRWGSAAPVKFTRDDDAWDFEIAVRDVDRCSPAGCVLASAFFPDAGRTGPSSPGAISFRVGQPRSAPVVDATATRRGPGTDLPGTVGRGPETMSSSI